MKVIFLDIDGVLNNDLYYKREGCDFKPYPLSEFDEACVERLNKIVELTGARIVLSSSWRLDETTTLKRIFKQVGLPEFYDKTPYLFNANGYKGITDITRGDEIAAYLNKSYIDNYVILDDETDILDNQQDHFVHCKSAYGLTDTEVEKAVSILGSIKDEARKYWESLTPFKSADDIPDILNYKDKTIILEIVIPNLIRCGAIPKKDLEIGKTYIGSCRNASEAQWNGNIFKYIRHKFDFTYNEEIEHFEDAANVDTDVFIPFKEKINNNFYETN